MPDASLAQKARDLAAITDHDAAALDAAARAPEGSPSRWWLLQLIDAHVLAALDDPVVHALLVVPSRYRPFRRPIEWHEVVAWHRERLGLL